MQHFRKLTTLQEDFAKLGLIASEKNEAKSTAPQNALTENEMPGETKAQKAANYWGASDAMQKTSPGSVARKFGLTPEEKKLFMKYVKQIQQTGGFDGEDGLGESHSQNASKKQLSLSEARLAVNKALEEAKKKAGKKKSSKAKAKKPTSKKWFMVQGKEQVASLSESLKDLEGELSGATKPVLVRAFESVTKVADTLKLRFDQVALAMEEAELDHVGDKKVFDKAEKEGSEVDVDDKDLEHVGDDKPFGDSQKPTKDAPDAPAGDYAHMGDDLKAMKEDAMSLLDKLKKDVMTPADAESVLKDMVCFLGGAMEKYMDLDAGAPSEEPSEDPAAELHSDSDDESEPRLESEEGGEHVGTDEPEEIGVAPEAEGAEGQDAVGEDDLEGAEKPKSEGDKAVSDDEKKLESRQGRRALKEEAQPDAEKMLQGLFNDLTAVNVDLGKAHAKGVMSKGAKQLLKEAKEAVRRARDLVENAMEQVTQGVLDIDDEPLPPLDPAADPSEEPAV